jgi:hypothetical protein
MVNDTAIKLKIETKKELDKLKIIAEEPYDNVVQRLINVCSKIRKELSEKVDIEILQNVLFDDFANYKKERAKNKK